MWSFLEVNLRRPKNHIHDIGTDTQIRFIWTAQWARCDVFRRHCVRMGPYYDQTKYKYFGTPQNSMEPTPKCQKCSKLMDSEWLRYPNHSGFPLFPPFQNDPSGAILASLSPQLFCPIDDFDRCKAWPQTPMSIQFDKIKRNQIPEIYSEGISQTKSWKLVSRFNRSHFQPWGEVKWKRKLLWAGQRLEHVKFQAHVSFGYGLSDQHVVFSSIIWGPKPGVIQTQITCFR